MTDPRPKKSLPAPLVALLVAPALAALVAGGLALADGAADPSHRPEVRAAQLDLQTLSQVLVQNAMHTRAFPARLDDLDDPAVPDDLRVDPWGHAYRYVPGADGGYTLCSAGLDEAFDTDDDLCKTGKPFGSARRPQSEDAPSATP